MICEICDKEIVKDAHGGEHPSAGDHDPAFHVARTYHYFKVYTKLEIERCVVDKETWPCPTAREYIIIPSRPVGRVDIETLT